MPVLPLVEVLCQLGLLGCEALVLFVLLPASRCRGQRQDSCTVEGRKPTLYMNYCTGSPKVFSQLLLVNDSLLQLPLGGFPKTHLTSASFSPSTS
eukprot:6161120-Ditylum_brightwellii.AAC.1